MLKTIVKPLSLRLGSIAAGAVASLAYTSPELLAHIEAAVAGLLLIAFDIVANKRWGD